MRFQLDIPVRCTDGPCGELCDVVIDPATRRVTHLVVGPHYHHHGLARLVPVAARGDALGKPWSRASWPRR